VQEGKGEGTSCESRRIESSWKAEGKGEDTEYSTKGKEGLRRKGEKKKRGAEGRGPKGGAIRKCSSAASVEEKRNLAKRGGRRTKKGGGEVPTLPAVREDILRGKKIRVTSASRVRRKRLGSN